MNSFNLSFINIKFLILFSSFSYQPKNKRKEKKEEEKYNKDEKLD